MINEILSEVKKECLVFDLETSSFYDDGSEVNLRSNYEDYIENAQVKWFGAYSYKTNKGYLLNPKENLQEIFNLLESHSILIGFNSEEFDFPILLKNGMASKCIRYLNIDCMQILGQSTTKNRNGYAYKNRGELMNYDFNKNSLRHMAEVMNLDFQKGEIDFKLFQKDSWTQEEIAEIKTYLKSDVMAVKQMFDKLWDYWKPFTELLSEKNIRDLSWIKSSIASLTYKSACHFMNEEPTYSEQKETTEDKGGRVLLPKYEEANKVWYIDFASLYPHIFCMFNLFAEKNPTESDNLWHGNDFFQVKGHYDISTPHTLALHVQKMLKQRLTLKKESPDNPLVYTLKIFLNGLYGVVRSSIFEKVHTPNAGWDCCWLGQQIHEIAEEMMKQYGFEILQGDSVKSDTPVLIKEDNIIKIVPIEDLSDAPNTSTKNRFDLRNKNIEIWTDKHWAKIRYIYKHKTKKEMFRILTRTAFIEVSKDHSLMINNKKVSPNDLKVGDNIETIQYRLPNFTKVDNDLAWLLGFYLAEGSCGIYKYTNQTKNSWAINQKKKEPLIKAQKILLQYGIQTKILNTLKSSNCYKLVPYNKNIKLVVDLFSYWCLTKTKQKTVPYFILSANQEAKENFLDGYFLGDGSIDKITKIKSFCSIDKSLFHGICLILKSLGYDYSLKTRKDKPNVMTARIIRDLNNKNLGDENKIKKIEKYTINNEYIYDIETDNHHFCGGVGNINLHNTDSIFCRAIDEKHNNREYVEQCCKNIVEIIKEFVPFKIDTFKLSIETYIEHLMCPFSEQPIKGEDGKNKKEGHRLIKERKGLKKNYLYVYEKDGKKDIKLVGLPIIKNNATKLGIKIYEEVLKPLILEKMSAKFERKFIDNTLDEYLKKEEILRLIAREFRVNPAKTYKLKSQIQAQISDGYFDGQAGTIELIKNAKVGKAGKGDLYCTIKEAIENNLTYKDINLDKIYNELEPFIKYEKVEIIEPKKMVRKKIKDKPLKEKKLKKIEGSISAINSKKDNPS
jgi:hypothetical protein